MSGNMMIHCGGDIVSFEQLADYQVPEVTETYVPVAHVDLANMVRETSTELLKRECVKENYAVVKNGQRMFALQTFANGEQEVGVSVAFRNSYDKSMSIGIAMGFRVFICDNLAISGDIKIMRKHTKRVFDDIDQVLVHTLFRKGPSLIDQFHADVKILKQSVVKRMQGYEFLGHAYGCDILKPTQMSVAANEWEQITKREEVPDAWQLYNAITWALKSTPPQRIMEAHRDLHGRLLAYINPA